MPGRREAGSPEPGPYVIGVDAGGTHTRAAVVTLDGTIAGYGTGPGANPNSGGDIATALTGALTDALTGLDTDLVEGGVFGIAGAGAAGRPRAVAAADTAWRALGLTCDPEVVTDIVVAFAAGSTESAGIVIFAGTGAGAAVINDGVIERRADAYGWLVGDEGSAVWIGREAVRAVLRAHDGRGPATALADSVPRAMLGADAEPLTAEHGGPDLPQAIIKAVYGEPPSALGRMAPLVSAAAEAGDAVARGIVDEAAQRLLEDVDAIRPALADLLGDRAGTHGLVVAGSLLERGPVADAVRGGLLERFGAEPAAAGDGAVGAARLAIRRLGRA
jgi:N-acetylglucosamine kinase-like BadF-type ATPase